jgi:hypothetical protein
MRDVYDALLGKNVIVYTVGSILAGKLEQYNGFLLRLTSAHAIANTYIPVAQIVAICSND